MIRPGGVWFSSVVQFVQHQPVRIDWDFLNGSGGATSCRNCRWPFFGAFGDPRYVFNLLSRGFWKK